VDSRKLTALVLAWNEAVNIRRCLERLNWVKEVIVVDSGSTDDTLAICHEFGNVRTLVRSFDNHTNQWNFGLSQVSTPWVLCLDADYVCPERLEAEFSELQEGMSLFEVRFRYLIFGVPLRGTLYPSKVVLFKSRDFTFMQDGHTQKLDSGTQVPAMLRTTVDHDDRKSLSRWINSQIKYAALEADKLQMANPAELLWKDRVRMWVLIAPILTVPYCLFWKLLILDGWFGALYTLQRVFAELLLSLEILDRRLRNAVIRSPDALQRPLGKDAEK